MPIMMACHYKRLLWLLPVLVKFCKIFAVINDAGGLIFLIFALIIKNSVMLHYHYKKGTYHDLCIARAGLCL